MDEQNSRTARLLGEDGVKRVQNAHVAVFGVGGVGSYAAEAMVRTGVGTVTIVDFDTVDVTNINRQIHAAHRPAQHARSKQGRRNAHACAQH